jgi:hypothetical protein
MEIVNDKNRKRSRRPYISWNQPRVALLQFSIYPSKCLRQIRLGKQRGGACKPCTRNERDRQPPRQERQRWTKAVSHSYFCSPANKSLHICHLTGNDDCVQGKCHIFFLKGRRSVVLGARGPIGVGAYYRHFGPSCFGRADPTMQFGSAHLGVEWFRCSYCSRAWQTALNSIAVCGTLQS